MRQTLQITQISIQGYGFPVSYEDLQRLLTDITLLALAHKREGVEKPIKISESIALQTLEKILNDRYFFVLNTESKDAARD